LKIALGKETWRKRITFHKRSKTIIRECCNLRIIKNAATSRHATLPRWQKKEIMDKRTRFLIFLMPGYMMSGMFLPEIPLFKHLDSSNLLIQKCSVDYCGLLMKSLRLLLDALQKRGTRIRRESCNTRIIRNADTPRQDTLKSQLPRIS